MYWHGIRSRKHLFNEELRKFTQDWILHSVFIHFPLFRKSFLFLYKKKGRMKFKNL